MKELLSILNILKSTTPRVLATLGKAEGSSYRRAGARLIWGPSTPRSGSISGGCLEDDLIQRAREVLEHGSPETVVYDTTGENDLVWGVGLGCHGIVTVLLERLNERPAHWDLLERAWSARQPAVFLTVIRAPSPDLLGTRFAVSGSGETVRRGPELANVHQVAEACLQSRESRTFLFPGPGGDEEIFCEYLPPPVALTVLGAGEDAKPLVRLAKELGWEVRVVDPRPAYATQERFPEADVVTASPAEEVGALEWDDWNVAVVMTHHYRFDVPLLRALLPRELRYLGLLGPKKRAERILTDLAEQGLAVTEAMLARLHAPVGLDLGGSSPEEVAASILAEIQGVLNGRDGRPLRERTRPIHGS